MSDVPPFDPTIDTAAPGADPTAGVIDPGVTVPAVPPLPVPAPEPEPAPEPDAPELHVGQVVEHTFFDPYSGPGGQEITVTGLVTHIGDDGARVCWLEASDPIPTAELTAL